MRKALGILLSAVLFAAGTQVLGTPPAAVAAPVSCSGSAKIFDNRSGNLFYYEHHTPSTGTVSWTQGRQVGTGFNGVTVAGPDGLVYYVNAAGELRRYRFDGTNWTENGTLLGTGWGPPYFPAAAMQMSVDAAGRLFAVDYSRNLRVFDASVPQWNLNNGIPLDVSWTTAPIAAGNNVFYRLSAGDLYRYRYDPDSQRLTGGTEPVGSGFGNDLLFSPGGDVLYRIVQDGNLYWYRYDADTDTWANGGVGRLIGTNWGPGITTRSNTCTTATPGPIGNVTPESIDPARAFQGTGNEDDFAWTFITAPGRAQQVIGAANGRPGLLGTQELASNLSSASTHDTKRVVGIDSTGQVWLAEAASGSLYPWTKFGRGMTKIRLSDASINFPQAVATDSAGNLWWRQRLSSGWTAWRPVFAGAPFRGFLDVASADFLSFGVASAPGSDRADYWFSIEQNLGVTFRFGALPSAADFDVPSVADLGGGPALVARHKATGQPYVLIGSGGGFDGATWTALPPLASGVTVDAAAPMAADEWLWGRLAIAARGSDGYVYVTTRKSSDGTVQPWQRVGEPAANAPALTDGGGMGMHLGYRGMDGKLYHFIDGRTPPPAGPLVFTGGGY
jgi:hypothetical protein